jgi:cytochrome b561
MRLRNTSEEFGAVSKTLHWTIAVLILLAYVIVYIGVWFYVERTPPRRIFLRTHGLVGMAVGVLVLVRLSGG